MRKTGGAFADMTMRFELHKSMFAEAERVLCRMGEFEITTFVYPSGVHALRLGNARGEIVMLPFQGLQIWRAVFDGRDLTMRSMFPEPVATREYLATYGAFLIHCGLAGLGAPGPTDSHPLHAELPNAPFQEAWLEVDEAAGTIAVCGVYRHTIAFSTNYRATVRTTLSAGSALLDVSVEVENLKNTAMDLMYLAHANFRPVDDGVLHYSANYDAGSVRVRRSIPAHVTPKPGYAEFLEALANDPAPHHVLKPGLAFDPEVVFAIDMKTDADGYAHALQLHPDGTADYLRYRPDQAPVCMRWICRTPDQDGLGIAFPATSGVEGHAAEKARGNVPVLEGGKTWRLDMQLGLLTAAQARETADAIDKIRGV